MISLSYRHGGTAHNLNAAIDSYILFQKDWPARQGGGVAFYVKEQLEYIELCLGVYEEWVESFWVRIKEQANMCDTVVDAYYKPPEQEEEVDEAESSLSHRSWFS